MDFNAISQNINTPFYIYDFDMVKDRFLLLKNAFKARKSLIFYAIKANSNLSLLKMLNELGSGFDCVSYNELLRALKIGADPYKIIFSGVGKTKEELLGALNANILYINVESFDELKTLENIAKDEKKVARISIRVNPNVDAKTHPYISTGLSENKFGVSFEEATKMYLYASKSDFLEPVGIHFHIGSNLHDLAPIHESAGLVYDFVGKLKAANINLRFFDVGGGLGVGYEEEYEPNLYDYAQGIFKVLKDDMTVCLEPGRFLVANAGYLVTKLIYQKTNQNKTFYIVDASMSELIRPSLYEAYHEVFSLKDSKDTIKVDVVGGVCESGDFLAKDINLPKLDNGDILVVKSAGAYGYSMSSNYNSRTKIAEYAKLDGKIIQINKAQSFEDMIKTELECL